MGSDELAEVSWPRRAAMKTSPRRQASLRKSVNSVNFVNFDSGVAVISFSKGAAK